MRAVTAHTRRVREDDVGETESVPFFDETRVPVETIAVPNPHAQGLAPDQYEVIAQKVTYRLAQRPGTVIVGVGHCENREQGPVFQCLDAWPGRKRPLVPRLGGRVASDRGCSFGKQTATREDIHKGNSLRSAIR